MESPISWFQHYKQTRSVAPCNFDQLGKYKEEHLGTHPLHSFGNHQAHQGRQNNEHTESKAIEVLVEGAGFI